MSPADQTSLLFWVIIFVTVRVMEYRGRKGGE